MTRFILISDAAKIFLKRGLNL